jgi:beta-phosphoglucomutase
MIPVEWSIFCDMDGTLIDTDYANYLAYRRALEIVTQGEYSIEFKPRERLNRESLQKRIPSLTDCQMKSIVYLKTRYFCDYIEETRLNYNLANFIRKCDRVAQCILVTTCRKGRVLETLHYHNMYEYFTRLVCYEELLEARASNKYAYSLELVGANPNFVLVFENEISEIEKAILAGIPRKNINFNLSLT